MKNSLILYKTARVRAMKIIILNIYELHCIWPLYEIVLHIYLM